MASHKFTRWPPRGPPLCPERLLQQLAPNPVVGMDFVDALVTTVNGPSLVGPGENRSLQVVDLFESPLLKKIGQFRRPVAHGTVEHDGLVRVNAFQRLQRIFFRGGEQGAFQVADRVFFLFPHIEKYGAFRLGRSLRPVQPGLQCVGRKLDDPGELRTDHLQRRRPEHGIILGILLGGDGRYGYHCGDTDRQVYYEV